MTTRAVTLLSVTAVCAVFWLLALLFPLYVGAAALILGTACLTIQIVVLVRRAFTFRERDLVDFVAGKTPRTRPEPVIPHNLKGPATGRFISRKAAMRAALERAVGAK